MSFFKKIFLIVTLGIFLVAPFTVSAQQAGERIDMFDAHIEIRENSSVRITETITYNFDEFERHGIYRDISVKYATTLGRVSIDIGDISVFDENGKGYEFDVEQSGGYKRIKIGDPDVLVTGVKIYKISYTVNRAISYFDDFDELYWNVTGNGWDVPIIASRATVVLPVGAPNTLKMSCYKGVFGSNEACLGMADPNRETVSFNSRGNLNPGEGLTVAVGFDKGNVYEPTLIEKIFIIVKDNFIIVVPVVVFIFLLLRWYKKGRDPLGRGTIIPEYDAPEGLLPLEISGLLHQGARQKDISAEIISLAVRGYIKINHIPKEGIFKDSNDYELEKLKEPVDLPEFDTKLMESLFGSKQKILISDLKEKFYTKIPGIKKGVMNSLITKGYYLTDPKKTIIKYVIVGILVGILGVFLGQGSVLAIISFIVTAILILVFGFIMPVRTKKGAEVRESILGLKKYITVAEEERIKFHNAPAKKPELFEKLLPYAMVFGAEEEWAKEFEGMYTTPPSWYHSPTSSFNSVVFAHSLHSFSSTTSSTLASAPGGSGSGGGGSSGGGVGGGGGGSW